MFNALLSSAVAMYQKQTGILSNFERFFHEFESVAENQQTEILAELSIHIADEEHRLLHLRNEGIYKILHYLHNAGFNIEFSVDFLFESLEKTVEFKQIVYILLIGIFTFHQSSSAILLFNRIQKDLCSSSEENIHLALDALLNLHHLLPDEELFIERIEKLAEHESKSIATKAIMLLGKAGKMEDFIIGIFKRGSNHQTICICLHLFCQIELIEDSLFELILQQCCKYNVLTIELIKICCKRGNDGLRMLLQKFKMKIKTNSVFVYELFLSIPVDCLSDNSLLRFLTKSISVIFENGDKYCGLVALKKLLQKDAFAAIPYESIILECYFQDEDTGIKQLALECIILTLNAHNAVYIREILESELWNSFDARKFVIYLKTFLLNSEHKKLGLAIKSFTSQVDKNVSLILSFMDAELHLEFQSAWEKLRDI